MPTPTVYESLQLATSPVILISACGLLLLSMTNRLGRAIDRAHMLVKEPNPNKQLQIHILVQRARWIRSAILHTSIAILLTSILVLVLFFSVFLTMKASLLVALLFIGSLLNLALSIGYFIADIFGSLRAMKVDLENIETN